MEGIRGLPMATILCGHSSSYHHQIVYLLQADGDTRLNCRVRRALELPLGVAPHLQGEDPTAEEGTVTLGALSPRSFRSSIASSNKRKCCGSDRVGGLDHDSEVSGYSWS